MRKPETVFILVLVLALLLCGCSGLRQLPPEKFLAQAQQVGQMGSFSHTDFIGFSGPNVYLSYWRAPICFGNGVHRVYYTRVADLPPEVQSELKAGRNPWGPKKMFN